MHARVRLAALVPILVLLPAATPAAVIETDVRPRKARVFLDGEEVGLARDYDGRWDRLVVPAGTHLVELMADGYRTLRLEVVARESAPRILSFELEPGRGLDPRSFVGRASPTREPPPGGAPPSPARRTGTSRGFLDLRIEPRAADVYLDGEYLASGGELARLHGAVGAPAGWHRVEVVAEGHARSVRRVRVEPGKSTRVEIRLRRE